MSLLSADFLLLVVVSSLAFRVAPNALGRTLVVAVANAVFLASFVETVTQLLPLAAFLVQGWLLTQWLRRRPSRRLLAAGVAWMVVLFVLLKQYAFVQGIARPAHPFLVVGLSYVLFRVLHVMIDTASGERLQGLDPLRYFSYTTMFLCFVSGPIQRFEDYREQECPDRRTVLDGTVVFATLERVALGMVKVLLLGPVAWHVHEAALRSLAGGLGALADVPTPAQLGLALLAYLVYLYWNFSGSMDVVIGAGRLMGVRLPENFDRPFSTSNLIDFWSHWHITLSDWFRLYVFNPIVGAMTRLRADVKLAPYYGVVGFFVTFFVMGAWHGTTWLIILFGMTLGAGLSLNKLYQVRARAWLGRKRHRALTENWAYRRLGNGITIGYIATALSCIWLEAPAMGRLLHKVGWSGALAAFGTAVLATIVVRGAFDTVRGAASLLRLDVVLASPWSRQVVVAAELAALLVYASLTNSDAPPFVYADF